MRMAPRLGEFLYWMAIWIAAIVALLGVWALAQGGGRQAWVGAMAFFAVSGSIWLIGRTAMMFSRKK